MTGFAPTEKGGMTMTDREKVITAWKIFRDSNPYEICSGREFRAIREPEYCMGQMIEDTIALLKEQEDEIENLKQTAQSMMEGIVISTSMLHPCESCQEFNCDYCKFKRTRS